MTAAELLAALEPVVCYKADSLAARYRLGADLRDDLAQEGRAAVVEAAPRYDPAAASPAAFLTPRIVGAMLDALRGGLPLAVRVPRSAVARGVSMLRRRHEPTRCDRRELDPVSHADWWASVAQVRDPEFTDGAAAEFAAWVRGRFGVRRAEAEQLAAYFAEGKGFAELGREWGVCESAACLRVCSVIDRIRTAETGKAVPAGPAAGGEQVPPKGRREGRTDVITGTIETYKAVGGGRVHRGTVRVTDETVGPLDVLAGQVPDVAAGCVRETVRLDVTDGGRRVEFEFHDRRPA